MSICGISLVLAIELIVVSDPFRHHVRRVRSSWMVLWPQAYLVVFGVPSPNGPRLDAMGVRERLC